MPQLTQRVKTLWGAVTRKDILLPTAFVFLWQATPSADSAMFYFQTNQLGFQPEFLGRVRLVGSLASLAGEWHGLLDFEMAVKCACLDRVRGGLAHIRSQGMVWPDWL